MTVIVDGGRGEVILDPDAEALQPLRGARPSAPGPRAAAGGDRATSPAQTLDGTAIHLAANVELIEEIPTAVELGAESVGLFRTEFLYLERTDLPTEDEQYAHAVAALKSVGRAAPSPSAPWIWAATSCRASVRIPAGTTRRWGCGRSAIRSSARTCSARSCGRCTGPRRSARCASCFR